MNTLNHVAFIMDGNGRWGIKKKRNRNFGHLKGVEVVKNIIHCSIKLKIPAVTFYVFSSENWHRPRKEINFLFKLIKTYFLKERENTSKEGIKINIFGEINKLPLEVKKTLKSTVEMTNKNKKIVVNLAINYGSRNEILNSFIKNKNKISKKNFKNFLDTKNQPDPDILI